MVHVWHIIRQKQWETLFVSNMIHWFGVTNEPLLCLTHKWIKSHTLKVVTWMTHSIDSGYVVNNTYCSCYSSGYEKKLLWQVVVTKIMALQNPGSSGLGSPLLIDAPPAPQLIEPSRGRDLPPAYKALPILPRFTGKCSLIFDHYTLLQKKCTLINWLELSTDKIDKIKMTRGQWPLAPPATKNCELNVCFFWNRLYILKK